MYNSTAEEEAQARAAALAARLCGVRVASGSKKGDDKKGDKEKKGVKGAEGVPPAVPMPPFSLGSRRVLREAFSGLLRELSAPNAPKGGSIMAAKEGGKEGGADDEEEEDKGGRGGGALGAALQAARAVAAADAAATASGAPLALSWFLLLLTV
ncbi:hypothetical protein T492DRAFT_832524 [Pavlovales sp. CCMP2436]|nr:hypothetical protein T492DRAFT_832524 [Pavlovales sp. CCMP2436]